MATVDQAGNVTAVGEGTAVITAASWTGLTDSCTVTVASPVQPQPDPDPEEPGELEDFVTRCYRIALGRTPDPQGYADWCRWLKDGTVDAKGCAYGFVFSKEMNAKNLSGEDFVKTMYRLFMDREGEASGVAFWTGYLAAGHSRYEVFLGFADSVEFARIVASFGVESTPEVTFPGL